MKKRADGNRPLGSPIPRRWYCYLSDEGAALARINMLFRLLLRHEEMGESAVGAFRPVASAWVESPFYPRIALDVGQMGAEFIGQYFLVDNKYLLPLMSAEWHRLAIASEGSSGWAAFRIDALSWNPSPLGRPNHRGGGEYYAAVLSGKKAAAEKDGLRRYDLGSLWRYGEAWIEVRHKRAVSLRRLVDAQQVRGYRKRDGEAKDSNTRYMNWWRALQAFGAALNRKDLPVLMP